jgi:DNA polymerase-3 subunit alpha
MDFTSRVHKGTVNVKCFKAFVNSGCFDSLGYCRTELLEKADEVYGYWRDLRAYEDWIKERAAKEVEAVKTGKKVRVTKERLRPIFPVIDRLPATYQPTKEELRLQLDAIGVYLGVHPASLIRDNSIVKTDRVPSSGIFRVGAIVSKIKEIKSKSGPMAFITLEDDYGSLEGVCFTFQWRNIKETISADTLCIAELKVDSKKPGSYIVNKIINWEKK